MLTERPRVFQDDHSFIFIRQEFAQEMCEALDRRHIEFEMLSVPGRTIKFTFISLPIYDVERLMWELTCSDD